MGHQYACLSVMLVFLKCCKRLVAEPSWGKESELLSSGRPCLLSVSLPVSDHRTHDINKSFKVMFIIVGMNGGSDSAVTAR